MRLRVLEFVALAAGGIIVLWNLGVGRTHTQPSIPNCMAALKDVASRDLAGIDIARLNLLCAERLPGSEQLTIEGSLKTLNRWAERVKSETARHLYRFQRNPAEFNHSEAYFRVLMLITVLQQDFHVRYNPERITAPEAPEPDHLFFADSRDLFLHGITDRGMGTCVSLPVLYVAVGRRLGYPLKLATAHDHLFARWESGDGKERFNIEATSQGLTTPPDDYYKTWPRPPTEAELRSGSFLKSLTPAEELAIFLQTRGHCLRVAVRLGEARDAYLKAESLAPNRPENKHFLALVAQRTNSGSGPAGDQALSSKALYSQQLLAPHL